MRLSARCFAVTGLAYVPPWSVNAGFVCGDSTTLVVDTSATALSAASIYGYAHEVRPVNRIDVLNTEQHFDHIGGNSYFRDRGAEIYGHSSIHRTAAEFAAEHAEFNAAIPNAARRGWHEEMAFYHGAGLVNPTRPIDTQTSLDLGNCPVQILPTPGHTPSNLSLWIPEDRVLYCGDCLLNIYVANLDAGDEAAWRQWLRSIEVIEKLCPRTIVPGHGPVAVGDEVARMIDAVRSELGLALSRGRTRTSS